MNLLVLTVRFLDNRYHGLLTRKGPPEWPPSPYRLFQALVSGVARRGELVEGEDIPSNKKFKPIGQALGWLQKHSHDHPPIIITPKSKPHKKGDGVVRFVPNNDDETYWYPELHRIDKPTIPTLFLLEPDQKPELHYVWDISDASDAPVDRIRDAARSLTALGWGIDMAFADADRADEAKLQTLKGIRWYPKKDAWRNEGMLRTPKYDDEMKECTLCDLRHCHDTAMKRIEHGKPLKTVDKPKVFDHVLYTSTERLIGQPSAVFKLVDENDDTVAYPHAKLIHIAGMVRHLAIKLMKRHPPRNLRGQAAEQWVEQFVAGHRSAGGKSGASSHSQFSYIPLPSIGHAHADPAIRRVMVVAPLGDEAWLEHLAERLQDQPLEPTPDTTLPPGANLQLIPENRADGVRDVYTRESSEWASFTPVILPGHDDHKPNKTRALIENALKQSGIEYPCEFEWSAFSQFRKSYSAHKYDKDKRPQGYIRPGYLLSQTAVHLTLRFHDGSPEKKPVKVSGPLTIGAGRHCGFGLMAACDT